MSDTPLSDLIDLAEGSDRQYWAFLAAFRRSRLGVKVIGAPPGTAGNVKVTDQSFSLGNSATPDGRPVLLAFADPAAFVQRFGMQFNAEMSGEELMGTVLHNPGCHGIRVNSAKREISMIIGRDAIQRLQSGAVPPAPEPEQPKPWWKIW